MNKIVRNTGLIAIGALSLQSCGKQDLIDQNEKLTNQVNFYKNQAKLVWEMLNEAQDKIDENLITIDNLEGDIQVLSQENNELKELIDSLQEEIDRLEALIVDHENEVIRINNLLVIEQQKDVVNQEVIETLQEELSIRQQEYDSLIANPITVVEVRTEIVTQIVEVETLISTEAQQEIIDLAYNIETDMRQAQITVNAFVDVVRNDIVALEALMNDMEEGSGEYQIISDTRGGLLNTLTRLEGIQRTINNILN